MTQPHSEINLHPDRLLPADPGVRSVARRLYNEVKDLPIISPHGHTDPRWYADNINFPNPAQLFLIPDHYVFRHAPQSGRQAGELGHTQGRRRSD